LEVLGLSRQLLAALAHIHECSVVNLDVKPGNVLFRRRSLKFLRSSVPLAVLSDFGISRDLRYPRAGLLGVATPEYVSPEHALELSRDHQGVDPRSDIFSLGVVMYEMLVGQLPFADVGQLIDPTFVPIPPREFRPTIPVALEGVVLRALMKEPRNRFGSATEMLAALAQVPRPPDWGALGRRTAAGLALASALVGGGYGVNRLFHPPPPPPPLATPALVETPTLMPPAGPVAMPTATLRPISTTTATPRPTSTMQPTSTPTNTPRPPTSTPTPGG
jgi:serine/threonine-protein kinase